MAAIAAGSLTTIVLANSAEAASFSFDLEGVSFSDTGSLTGSFTYDNTLNEITAFDVVAGAGNVITTPFTYDDVTSTVSSVSSTAFTLTDNTTRQLEMAFGAALDSVMNVGDTIDIDLSAAPFFSTPSRELVQGQALQTRGVEIAAVIRATEIIPDELPPVGGIDVFGPDAPIAGFGQDELADMSTQFLYSAPASENPALDSTGEKAGLNQSGPIFYLASSFDLANDANGDIIAEVTRTITVPSDKSLFLPVVSVLATNLNRDTGLTVPELQAEVAASLDTVSELFVILNGEAVPNVDSYRQDTAEPFDYLVPEGNVLGVQLGDTVNNPGNPYTINSFPGTISPAITDGWWVGLNPLPVGQHTIQFGGTGVAFPDDPNTPEDEEVLFKSNITYLVTSTSTSVPEPTSILSFLALGFLGAGSALKRKLKPSK